MTAPFRARIIVVHDEPTAALELTEHLREFGYDVAGGAATGDEALELAERTEPDLALLGLTLGGARARAGTAEALRDRLGVSVCQISGKGADLRSAVEVALERSRLEREHREQRRWFSTALHAIGDAVISVTGSGRISHVNRAASALSGFSLERVRDRPFDDVITFIDDRSRTRLENPLTGALREHQQRALPACALLRTASGGEIAVDGAATPFENAAGRASGAILVLHDVSEQRRLQRQAELNDRLAALGTLAVGVTQEIDKPLAFVIGNQQHARRPLGALRELLDELEPKRRELARELVEEITAAIDDALSGAERVRTLVSELRNLGRPPTSQQRPLDVRSALDAALTVVSAQLATRTRVIREFGACPKVRADELRLTQVFVNLLLNAAQAIAPGAVDGNEVRIVTRTGLHGDALIEVKDSGTGISKLVLPRIFEPFFTTREPEAGSGLGLSISQGIVSAFGGSIEVESRVGEGSTFRVLLPACTESGTPRALRASYTPHVTSSRPDMCARLLFIDDEPILLDALTRALEGHYAVDRAPSAQVALELLESGTEYDLIVCDLMMPAMTGIDLFQALNRRFPSAAARMVFMTGGAFTLAAKDFIASAGRRVLEKPFSNDELFAFIATCLKVGDARNTERAT